ncbi:unnamed protein product [Miscanthus lutarioriparius]|uniref:Uncharacterized protein n=1 Tax=Miscanthus lutarioriparius TaxID=422564 RepID=A0A811QBM3_9POAL|nr:unnamed protein product [Miscanthus lutarioriparius]
MAAPAPREVWEHMVGEEITPENINLMLNERPEIRDANVYPMDYPPSPIDPGWVRLIVFYKFDENNKNTICWPAPYVMYGNNAQAAALTIG